MPTCYRHPKRETGVSCSNCGNPICPDCMTPTTVGMRCPDCARQRTPTRTLRSMAVEPVATYVLIAINVAVYFGASNSNVDLSLSKADIAANHVWLLVTSGFMHAGLLHLLLNMYALYWLGQMIEPALGHARFLAIYFASLLCGSLGVLLLQPEVNAVGASGAIFGLFGASLVIARNRNISLMQTGLLPVLVLNFVITFLPGSHIAFGAHVGGFLGGLAAAFVVEELARRRRGSLVPGVAFCVLLGAAAVAGSVLLA